MDQNTTAVVRLIEATELSGRDDLIAQAKRAFLDYLAALLAARREPAVENLRQMTDEGRASDRARLYGFASHYLDFDDAQANIAGHFSTVLYSVLLAVARPDDAVCDHTSLGRNWRACSARASIQNTGGRAGIPLARSALWGLPRPSCGCVV